MNYADRATQQYQPTVIRNLIKLTCINFFTTDEAFIGCFIAVLHGCQLFHLMITTLCFRLGWETPNLKLIVLFLAIGDYFFPMGALADFLKWRRYGRLDRWGAFVLQVLDSV